MTLKLCGFAGALALAVAAALVLPMPAFAHDSAKPHSHAAADAKKDVHKGYFNDADVKPRSLLDWEGDWQSLYPHLADGALDAFLVHKAEHGEKSLEEWRAYYMAGYKTDVERIVIAGQKVSFYRQGKAVSADYAADGQEILTYEKGNRGVRFIFKKAAGDADAPDFIQFSDHDVAPVKAEHFHLYWGNDRAALLKEVTNWPTYYPAALDRKALLAAMLAH